MTKRKPSKNAMFSYVSGVILFVLSIASYVWSEQEISVLYGLIGLTLLFVIGVQRDLYGE